MSTLRSCARACPLPSRHAQGTALLLLAFALAPRTAFASAPGVGANAADSVASVAPHANEPAVLHAGAGWSRPDRLRHASLSFTLASAAGLSGRSRGEAFAITFALGVAKEGRDARGARFDWGDLAADACGAALGALAAARH